MRRRYRNECSALRRWLRFNLVGVLGMMVQLSVLQLLTAERVDYRLATILAVETAILHNFCWHLRYTWRERRLHRARVVWARLLQFHATNGAVSLAGSFTVVTLLVGNAGMPVIAANLVSIGACSILNFLLSEVIVFRLAPNSRTGSSRSLALPSALVDG